MQRAHAARRLRRHARPTAAVRSARSSHMRTSAALGAQVGQLKGGVNFALALAVATVAPAACGAQGAHLQAVGGDGGAACDTHGTAGAAVGSRGRRWVADHARCQPSQSARSSRGTRAAGTPAPPTIVQRRRPGDRQLRLLPRHDRQRARALCMCAWRGARMESSSCMVPSAAQHSTAQAGDEPCNTQRRTWRAGRGLHDGSAAEGAHAGRACGRHTRHVGAAGTQPTDGAGQVGALGDGHKTGQASVNKCSGASGQWRWEQPYASAGPCSRRRPLDTQSATRRSGRCAPPRCAAAAAPQSGSAGCRRRLRVPAGQGRGSSSSSTSEPGT